MVKRKTSMTRVSAEALKKIEHLKGDSGKTSAQIIDDALNNHFDTANKSSERSNKLSTAFQAVFDKASSNKGQLDKDDPTVMNMAKVAKELGITPEQLDENPFELTDISIPFKSPQEFTEFFNKLRREYRKAFMKEMQSNPKFITLDNTKPPNGVIDSAILATWRVSIIARSTLTPMALRQDIIEYVYKRMNTPIDETSWGQFHKAWFKSYGKYKGKFEQTIDNRIYALLRNGIIKPLEADDLSIKRNEDGTSIETDKYESNKKIVLSSWLATEEDPTDTDSQFDDMLNKATKGVYVLTRELSKNEWTMIDGVLNIKPQRGIVIPKII